MLIYFQHSDKIGFINNRFYQIDTVFPSILNYMCNMRATVGKLDEEDTIGVSTLA